MKVRHGDMFKHSITGVILQYLFIHGIHYNKCIKKGNGNWKQEELQEMDEGIAKDFPKKDGWVRYYDFNHYLKQAELL